MKEQLEAIIKDPFKYSIFSFVVFILLLIIFYIWNPFKISTNFTFLSSLFLICVMYLLLIGYLISSSKNIPKYDISQNFQNIGVWLQVY